MCVVACRVVLVGEDGGGATDGRREEGCWASEERWIIEEEAEQDLWRWAEEEDVERGKMRRRGCDEEKR